MFKVSTDLFILKIRSNNADTDTSINKKGFSVLLNKLKKPGCNHFKKCNVFKIFSNQEMITIVCHSKIYHEIQQQK